MSTTTSVAVVLVDAPGQTEVIAVASVLAAYYGTGRSGRAAQEGRRSRIRNKGRL